MVRKVQRELSEMMKTQKKEDQIDDRLVQAQMREEAVRRYFNQQIHTYLRTNRKGM